MPMGGFKYKYFLYTKRNNFTQFFRKFTLPSMHKVQRDVNENF